MTEELTQTAPPPAKPLPPFNVVLLDSDLHSYDYVIDLMKRVFGKPEEVGMDVAEELTQEGRAIVMTTHKELAELKAEVVASFGPDRRLSTSIGSMTALVEPATR